MKAEEFIKELALCAKPSDAEFLQRFFKTGKGEYGEGDKFLGVRVPATRKVCKMFKNLPLSEIQKLLDSPIHEHRLAAVILLSMQYSLAKEATKQKIFDMYMQNLAKNRINNWDIVDVSAPKIVGAHLISKNRTILYKLAKSPNLWKRRASIISTFAFIRAGESETSLKLAEELLSDKQDLMHKAVGWTLREVGKQCGESLLTSFLDKNVHIMPRTMLRYAIERLPKEQRVYYMEL